MTKKSLGYVEIEWVCPNCGGKNPGPVKTCGACGSPQPENVQFIQARREELLTDEEAVARAKAGPDVHCPYCGARNPAGATVCTQCGGDLAEAARREAGTVLGAFRSGPAGEAVCPSCGSPNPDTAHTCANCGASLAQPTPEPAAARPAPPVAARKPNRLVAILGALLLCVCGGAAIFLFLSSSTETTKGAVQQVGWAREVAIERLQPVQHEAFQDDIPAGAQILSCSLEFQHTQSEPAPNAQEVCGTPYTVDKGSGYAEVVQDCEYQVYADYCKYVAQEWTVVETASLDGDDLAPVWPNPVLSSDERLGAQQEAYTVVFATDAGLKTYTTSDAGEFSQFQIGSAWMLYINKLDVVVSVEPGR